MMYIYICVYIHIIYIFMNICVRVVALTKEIVYIYMYIIENIFICFGQY